MDEKAFYKLSEVAERLSLGKTATYQLINAGRIRIVRFGSAVRVSATELARFEQEVVEQGSIELRQK